MACTSRFSFETPGTMLYDKTHLLTIAHAMWLTVKGGGVMTSAAVNYTPLTPLSFLARSAAVYPDKTAVVYRDQRYTYRQFQQRVNRLATALQGVGVTPGDRVAFLCPNTPPMLEAHYGVPLAGAILVAINIRLSSPEIAYILHHSGAKVLCVDSELAVLVRPVRGQLPRLETRAG